MARKKKVVVEESLDEPVIYTANTRRNEVGGIGTVEMGDGVPLGEYLDAATIAHLVKNGYYTPEEITPEVQAALDKLKDG